MVFQIFLIAGSFFSLNLVVITNPVCKDVIECQTSEFGEFRSCCKGVCNVWKNCNGSCAFYTDCGVHELCVDNLCSLNTTRNFVKKLGHLKLKDYLICIGFVIGLFLFQLGLPLLYIYRDKVGFCLKCKWFWNKDNNEEDDEEEEEEEEGRPQTMSRRWPLFGFPRPMPMVVQYSRLSQLDESCSFESELYVQSRAPSQNLRMVQQQVENVFGVPPPVYATDRNAGEIPPDVVIVPDSMTMENESCDHNNELRAVDSDTNIDGSGGMQELENYEERDLTRAEQQFNLAMSIPPPYERASFTQRDDINSPGNDLTDDLSVERSLKQLYKLPSYNSINKIPEEDEILPPSYNEVSGD